MAEMRKTWHFSNGIEMPNSRLLNTLACRNLWSRWPKFHFHWSCSESLTKPKVGCLWEAIGDKGQEHSQWSNPISKHLASIFPMLFHCCGASFWHHSHVGHWITYYWSPDHYHSSICCWTRGTQIQKQTPMELDKQAIAPNFPIVIFSAYSLSVRCL